MAESDEEVRIPGRLPGTEIYDTEDFEYRGFSYEIYTLHDENWWAWAHLTGDNVERVEELRVLGFLSDGRLEPFTSYSARRHMSQAVVAQRLKEEVMRLVDWLIDKMYTENAERMERMFWILSEMRKDGEKRR